MEQPARPRRPMLAAASALLLLLCAVSRAPAAWLVRGPVAPSLRCRQRGGNVRRAAEGDVAEAGSRVSMTFQTVRNKDGTVLDSSEGKGTLDFIVGSKQVMPRLEEAVVGMSAGDSQDVDISGVFGERDPEKVANVPVDELPPAIVPGTQLTVQGPSGPMPATVAKIGETEAVLDFNHPWAGEELTMKVTMVEVLPPGAPIPGQEGLEVKTLSPGDGKTYPKAGDQLEMHYTGTLAADGTKFDSSVDRGEPFSFTIGVGQVILGWDVGVMKMSLGEKAELRIPSSMGYGERGAGGVIPPNADLVFEVELLSIN